MIKKLFIFIFVFFITTEIIAIPNQQIKYIVFDFGGVIANVNDSKIKEFLMNSFWINKIELSLALIDMQNYITKGGSEELFWMKYSALRGAEMPVDWFEQYTAVIKMVTAEIPETIAIVKKLQKQKYKTAMLSNITQHQAKIIKQMGYYDIFHPVLLSYNIGAKKPDSKAFKILLEKLKLPADFVLFVDDKNENVEAAKKEGIDSIQYINPLQFQGEMINRGFDLS